MKWDINCYEDQDKRGKRIYRGYSKQTGHVILFPIDSEFKGKGFKVALSNIMPKPNGKRTNGKK